MKSRALGNALDVVREAIQNVSREVRAVYILFVCVGVLVVLFGWRVDELGWAADHPYLAGLLDGLTAFCFGVPVGGLIIAEINRRSAESAERSWLDDLIGALQALLGVQLPAHRQWLSEAVKDPPTLVRVASWTESSLLPKKNAAFLLANIQQGGPPATDEERQRIVNAAQERATNDLRDELMDLGRHLDALAELLDAAATCRTALS